MLHKIKGNKDLLLNKHPFGARCHIKMNPWKFNYFVEKLYA